MQTESKAFRALAMFVLVAMLGLAGAPVAAADNRSEQAAPSQGSGTSLAEKVACAYLLVGGAIMLYYGPKEKDNGELTRDGRSEAYAGGIAIGISVALLRDILKKRQHGTGDDSVKKK